MPQFQIFLSHVNIDVPKTDVQIRGHTCVTIDRVWIQTVVSTSRFSKQKRERIYERLFFLTVT